MTSKTSTSELEITIREWLIAARQMGRRPSTVEKYDYVLSRFARWMARRNITALARLDKLLLREWGANLYERGLQSSTARQHTAAVRSFLQWCREEKLINEPLADVLKLPPVRKRVQRTLSYEEPLKMIEVCQGTSAEAIRNVALISLLVDSGLRASELCRLRVSDVEFDVRFITPDRGIVSVNVIRVRSGKGDKDGHAYFGVATAERLQAWLETRSTWLRSQAERYRDRGREGRAVEVLRASQVFIGIKGTKPGSPLTVSGLRVILRKIGLRAGITGVTTHAFRRSFACFASGAGAPSRDVQQWGRWEHIEEFEGYTQAYTAGPKFMEYAPADFLERIAANGKQGFSESVK